MFNKFHSRRHPILNHKIRTLATIYGVDDDHALPTTDSSHNTYLSFNMECLAVLKIVVVIEPNAWVDQQRWATKMADEALLHTGIEDCAFHSSHVDLAPPHDYCQPNKTTRSLHLQLALLMLVQIICSNTKKETSLLAPPTVVSMPWCPPHFGRWMIGLKSWKAVTQTQDSSMQFLIGTECQPCLIIYEWGGWCKGVRQYYQQVLEFQGWLTEQPAPFLSCHHNVWR